MSDYKAGSKPITVGTIVFYHLSDREKQLSSGEKYIPAIVTRTNDDGSVNLTAFNDNPSNTYQKGVKEGIGGSEWSWPDLEPKPTALKPPAVVTTAPPHAKVARSVTV